MFDHFNATRPVEHKRRLTTWSDARLTFLRLFRSWRRVCAVTKPLTSGPWTESEWSVELVICALSQRNKTKLVPLQPVATVWIFFSVTEIETYSESFLQVTDISTPWSGSNILIKWPYWYLGLLKSQTEKSLADRHFVVHCMGENKLVIQSYTRTQNKFVPVMPLPSLPGVRLILV